MGCCSSNELEFHADPRKDDVAIKENRLPGSTKPQPLSTVLVPKQPESYYIGQANEYFDSLDTSVEKGKPNYSVKVARWEWPPWLILTGFHKQKVHVIDGLIRASGPCICVNRTLKFFPQNPYIRSVITFYYGKSDIENKENPLQIYEEFTFNDSGEITFVEAWYDQPYKDLLPPLDENGWPISQESVKRLSTQIPGLGNPDGLIDLNSEAMIACAKSNQIVADFRDRAEHFDKAVATVLVEQLVQNKRSMRPANIPL